MPELLFEIGTEELPPGLINNLCTQIKENIKKELTENDVNVSEGQIKTFNTPRRLAVYIQNLPSVQDKKEVEIKGPDKSKAFDKDGHPTQAAIGFAKKHNLEPVDLFVKKVNEVEYVFARTITGGKNISELLTDILPSSIKKTTGEKFMSWGSHEEKFARPIRWIVALLDKDIINFKYSNIKSSNCSYGHRFLSSKEIEIDEPKNYEGTLERNFVIASKEKRAKRIQGFIESDDVIKNYGSPSTKDFNSRIEEVTNITEYPCLLICEFDKEFLSLPPIIIETVLSKHQKYFVIYDKEVKKNNILQQFIVITNGTETENKAKNIVKAGNEKVVRARLNDAKFFYKEDLKTPFTFEVRGKRLDKITFQKGLGTMLDKVNRLLKLSEFIYTKLDKTLKIDKSDLENTIKLLKLDLTTQMVFEMPELQGETGGLYAKENDFNQDICNAISEQYLNMQSSNLGCLVSLLDKLDNIICLFSIGKIPTGSSDPFALRRQAQNIINIILQSPINSDFTEIFEYYRKELLPNELKEKFTLTKEKQIKEFLLERYINALTFSDNLKLEEDIINSVCSIGDVFTNLKLSREKILTISKHYKQNKESFNHFLIAAKRLIRIVEPTANGRIGISQINTEEEKVLLKLFEELNNKNYKTYTEFLSSLADLTLPINKFFDKVLVNDPDPKIKQNRQALLKKGKELFEKICDFNQIVERN